MPKSLTLLMAQINPNVLDIKANTDKIIQIITTQQNHHDLIVFPEHALTGYPLEDLWLRDRIYPQIETALAAIAACTKHCFVIVGHPIKTQSHRLNAASIFYEGKCIDIYHKQHLPNYSVFDEKRYFTQGEPRACILTIKGYQVGLCICEDLWAKGPVERLLAHPVDILVSINASPFEQDKYEQRLALLKQHIRKKLSIVYVNLIGGQDELVFDGQSFVLDEQGDIKARAPAFIEQLQTVQFQAQQIVSQITPLLEKPALIYQALLCGLSDYVNKNRFPGVVLGLSGGIDSALTLALAVDALGASRVMAVLMPSRFTATMSNQDALKQLETLQVASMTLPIEPVFTSFLTTLDPVLKETTPNQTEENIQARIRGTLLMALSNKTNRMLLSTSNKSECAVGYTTLYGDMCGGFAVLKDVYKTMVYTLAHYRNTLSPVIPKRVLTRAPTAELAFDQTDQDTLPPYDQLDAILTRYMEEGLDAASIIQLGYPKSTVLKVINLVLRNEYKRRQAPPGIKITACAFGRDWRFPITNLENFHDLR